MFDLKSIAYKVENKPTQYVDVTGGLTELDWDGAYQDVITLPCNLAVILVKELNNIAKSKSYCVVNPPTEDDRE